MSGSLLGWLSGSASRATAVAGKTGGGVASTMHTVNRFLALVAGGLTFLLMLVVVGDVAGRYVLRRPIPAALEITEILLPLIVFLAIAYTEAVGGNIRVIMLKDRLSLRKQVVLDVLAYALGLLVFSLVTWKTFAYAWSSWGVREVAQGIISLPVYPTKFGIALGSFLISLEFLTGLVSKMARLIAWKTEG